MDAQKDRWDVYEKDLTRLEEILKVDGPLSAIQLAELMACSKPTIYSRLAALRERGVILATKKIRVGSSGPLATGYLLENT